MILEYPQKICIYTGWPAIRDAFTRVANASFTSGAQSSRERSFEATMADRANAKQMAAVLNAAGRAVSCAASVEALLQGLCEAAVREGGAQAACALLPDGDGRLRFVAGAGENPGQTGMIGAAAAQGEGAEGIARERSGDEIALPSLAPDIRRRRFRISPCFASFARRSHSRADESSRRNGRPRAR
jgi:hypothetical protein